MAAKDILLGAGLAVGSRFVADIWHEWRVKRANKRWEVKDAQTSALLIEAEVEGLHASVQGFLERGWWSHIHTFWWQTRGDRLPVIADLAAR